VSDSRELTLFLQSLGQALAVAADVTHDGDAAAEIRRLAHLGRSITPAFDVRREHPSGSLLPVCRFWDEAIARATGAGSSLAGIVDRLAPHFWWTQNPNYCREPPGPGFLDHYGYAVIIGPQDGPPALAVDPRVAIGVLLLGPDTHYPLHSHPAVEVYYTLTEGEWWRHPGPWRREPPGSAIHHVPNIPHATRTGVDPLLAVYLWTGDLDTHASLNRC